MILNPINAFASQLSDAFVDRDFAFYGAVLQGQEEQRPRWKRCVAATQWGMGEALAKVYVERAFRGDSKDKAMEMITDIQEAFKSGLPKLAWMDSETAERALEKASQVDNKIGYPDVWRDYSSLNIDDSDWFQNVIATRTFESQRTINKVGKPVDKDEWFMPASIVNAYYNPLNNEMAFPAGILQPPFFDRAYPTAMNFGAIGMIMGHELTHGFDDTGRKFDPNGQMVQWWNKRLPRPLKTKRSAWRNNTVVSNCNLTCTSTAS